MIIDATDLIVGRFATVAAKKALLGEKVTIINCEKAVLTGSKYAVLAEYHRKRIQGLHSKGPFMPRMPDRFVRRIIRGMLPYKQEKGSKAYKRVMCYIGAPEEVKEQKVEKIVGAHVSKVPNLKYISIGELCKAMGRGVA